MTAIGIGRVQPALDVHGRGRLRPCARILVTRIFPAAYCQAQAHIVIVDTAHPKVDWEQPSVPR